MGIAVHIVGIVLLAAACLLLVPALILLVQIVAASWPQRRAIEDASSVTRPALAVLMPAHDEAGGIPAAISTVLPQLRAGDRLLVVADNCSDDTAAIARAAGAEVVERHDPLRRGKGYALDFGVRALEAKPPEVVIVVDADCHVAPGGLAKLASRCVSAQRPVQALYLMRSPAAASLKMRVAEFAWVVKNQVRPSGFRRLGLPCQLMGTGMAFPWAVIQGAALASGHLVEDMQLGLDLASAGKPPLFCPEARVDSVFPADVAAASSQRTRWEHGHLSVLASAGPRLLLRALARRDTTLAALALDVMVPPLASLVLALALLLLLAAAWWGAVGNALPFWVSAAAVVVLAVALVAAWTRYGKEIVTGGELWALPLYVAAKLPLYLRLIAKRQVEWVRTKRDERGS